MSAPKLILVTTTDADADLESIALYGMEMWDRERTLSYVTEIAKVLDSLARFPRLGRRGDDIGENVRLIRVRDHVVYYEHDAQAVTILRILHLRMNPEGQLGER